jgi:hypothetical protein
MIIEGLYNLIISTPAIASLVSNGASPPQFSVHLGSLRKGFTLPAIRLNIATTSFIITAQSTADLEYQTIQFDCIAGGNDPNGYINAKRLKDAVKSLLKDYAGTLADGTIIRASFLKNEIDDPLEESKGGYAFRSTLDIQFAYNNPST